MKLGKHAKIGLSWAFLTAVGVYSFYLSKESVVQRRYEHMKVRERIKLSNTGEYEQSPRKYAQKE